MRAYRPSIKKTQQKTKKHQKERRKKNCQAIYCNQSLMDRQKNSFSCSFQIISYHNCGYTLYTLDLYMQQHFIYSMCLVLSIFDGVFGAIFPILLARRQRRFSYCNGQQNGEAKKKRTEQNKRIHNDFLCMCYDYDVSRGKQKQNEKNQTKQQYEICISYKQIEVKNIYTRTHIRGNRCAK